MAKTKIQESYLKMNLLKCIATPILFIWMGFSIQPIFASTSSMEDLHNQWNLIKQYRAWPTAQIFKAKVGETAGGAVLYAKLANGEYYTLLGLRDDCNAYCNPGGRSEEDHLTVAQTAAQEICEETVGIYAPHSILLSQQPYIDYYNDSLLYRLYFLEVEYVSEDFLNKKLKETDDQRSKEFKRLLWLPIKKLRSALKNRETSFMFNGENIPVYRPLINTLNNRGGFSILKSLSKKNKPSQFRKSYGLFNKLYIPGNFEVPKFKIYWNGVNCETLDNKKIPFGQNASGEMGCMKLICHDNKLIFKSDVLFDELREKKILGHAVAAHAAAMNELKDMFTPRRHQRFKNIETASDLQMQCALKGNYSSPEDDLFSHLKTEKERVKAAFMKNMKNLYSFDEHALERLWEAYAYVKENAADPAFFHGATGEIKHLWSSFTCLHRLIRINPLRDSLSLRGTHIYYQGLTNDSDILNKLKDRNERNVFLWLNMAFNSGPTVFSDSSSSSVGYWASNHSVREPINTEKFEEATALMGFVSSYAPFESLFEQYVAQNSPNRENGTLLIIQPLDQNAEDHFLEYSRRNSYGFTPYMPTYRKLMSSEYLGKNDFPEIRLLTHPNCMDQIKIRSFDFYPLRNSKHKKFDQKMRDVAIAMLGDWLAQNTKIMPGSYAYPVHLKKLYHYVSGLAHEEKVTLEGVLYLMEHGQFEPVFQLLDLNKNFIPSVLKKALELNETPFLRQAGQKYGEIHKVLTEKEIGVCLFKEGIEWRIKSKNRLNGLFKYAELTPEFTKSLLLFCFLRGDKVTIDEFFKIEFKEKQVLNTYFSPQELAPIFWENSRQFLMYTDLSLFSKETHSFWLQKATMELSTFLRNIFMPSWYDRLIDEKMVQKKGPRIIALKRLASYVPQFEEVMSQTILRLCLNNASGTYQFDGPLTADYFLRYVVDYIEAQHLLGLYKNYDFMRLLKSCLNAGPFSFSGVEKTTGEAYIFRILRVFDRPWHDVAEAIMLWVCKEHNDSFKINSVASPFKVKNKKGETIMEHYQREFLRGEQPHWILDHYRQMKSIEDKDSFSDSLFVKVYGTDYKVNISNSDDALENKVERDWITGWIALVSQNVSTEILQEYMDSVPSHKIFHRFRESSEKFGIDPWKSFKIAKERAKKSNNSSLPYCCRDENCQEESNWLKKIELFLKHPNWQDNEFKVIALKMLHERPATIKPDYIISHFLKDKYISILKNVIDILYPDNNNFYILNSRDRYTSFFIQSLNEKEFKIARFIFMENPYGKLTNILNEDCLRSYRYTESDWYENIKKDFPEYLEYESDCVDVFSMIFNENYRNDVPTTLFKDLVLSYPYKLAKISFNTLKPHVFSFIDQAMWSDEGTQFFIEVMTKYPVLKESSTPDGLTLKMYIINKKIKIWEYDKPKEAEEKKSSFAKRKRQVMVIFQDNMS